MIPAMRPIALCLLLFAGPLLAQNNPAATILRVAPPAAQVSGKKSAALLPTKPVAPGDRLRTGPGGRASLQIGGGVLTLGGDSELFLHSTAAGESADIGRLVLARGALRVQVARDPGPTPLDLRLNLGPLRLRAVGANLWTAAEPRGETVCLLAGSVDIEAELGTETLDRPGDCLFFSAQNRRMVLRPDGADTLARKLERTAFASDLANGRASVNVVAGPQGQPGVDAGGDADLPDAIPAPLPTSGFVIVDEPLDEPVRAEPAAEPAAEPPMALAPVAAPPVPEPAPVTASPPPPPSPPPVVLAPTPEFVDPLPEAPPPVAAPVAPLEIAALPEPPLTPQPRPEMRDAEPIAAEAWYVVVASPGSGDAAAAYASRLRDSGLEVAVRSGGGKHRVIVGPYPSRSAAAKERSALQSRLKITDAWLLQD
jgi:cell division septation protein DedD